MNQYTEIQSARNSEYKNAYAEWVASLTPKRRRELEAQGLLEPQVDPFHIGKQKDVSELSLAAEQVMPETAEGAEQAMLETAEADEHEPTWAALRLLISELLADNNPALGLDCLALVTGIGFMGESMNRIAKRHCVTRAAVSKRCVQLTKQLRMMPSRAMRSLTAREAYRATQETIRQDHERFNSK